jgi:hypothetical protein
MEDSGISPRILDVLPHPRAYSTDTNQTRSWVGSRAGLDAVARRQIGKPVRNQTQSSGRLNLVPVYRRVNNVTLVYSSCRRRIQ